MTLRGIHRSLLFVISALALVLSAPVFATDPISPRSSCPPVEEEIIDLEKLTEMLADTKAIGLLAKLGLRKNIKKVLKRLEAYHDGKGKFSLEELEEQYDLLLMKIASQLQDKDLMLHRHLCNAWLEIWNDLSDFDKFHEHRL